MLIFYILAGVVGAVFIVATIVMGGSDLDADVDADVDVHADVDAHADVDTHLDADADHGDLHVDGGVWLPFLSFRFWTYFACFFGATGTVLTLLGHGFVISLIFSTLVGVLTGWMASYVMRRLATEQVSSDVTSSDYVGLSGKVIVPVGGGKQGQVRVFVKGSYVDLVAESDTPKPIAAQSEVLVFEMRGPVAKVVPGPDKEEDKEESQKALPEPSKTDDSEPK